MKNKELTQRRIQKLNTLINKINSSLNVRDILNSRKILGELREVLDDLSSIIERED